ncbi:NAD(P)H-dependent oxidoreductase [Nonomuraea jabiensis]|uniref:NAD(P)H-dependent oxidoreductase n=1 Tax=Nonomuraea jabiensis TaxID=882448 RepID=UPI003D7590CF
MTDPGPRITPGARVPADVAAEQARLDAAEVWAFIYPVWWTDCPARLKGWFDRVWTAGFAYKPVRLRVARQALVLCTAGYSVAELDASGCHQAMRTTMLTDRIGERARSSEFVVFGGSVLRNGESAGDPDHWAAVKPGIWHGRPSWRGPSDPERPGASGAGPGD